MQDPAQGQHSLPILIHPEDQLFRTTVRHGIRRTAVHDDDVVVAQMLGIAAETTGGQDCRHIVARSPSPRP